MLIERLENAYRKHNISIRVGLNPDHYSGFRYAPFAEMFKNGESIRAGGGLSLQELYFLECLASAVEPDSVLIIGNAMGWSTLAFGLLFPKSRIVAMDSTEEGESRAGINLTNQIAWENKLSCKAVVGTSPRDVADIVASHLSGTVDLALIDGLHTSEQQMADFNAIKPFLSPSAIVLFHDVVNFRMEDSFRAIADGWRGVSLILHRTPSGMAFLGPENCRAAEIASLFTDKHADRLRIEKGPHAETLDTVDGHLLLDTFLKNARLQNGASIRGWPPILEKAPEPIRKSWLADVMGIATRRPPTTPTQFELSSIINVTVDTSRVAFCYSLLLDLDVAITRSTATNSLITVEASLEVSAGNVGIVWLDENNAPLDSTERFVPAKPGLQRVLVTGSSGRVRRLAFRNTALEGATTSFIVRGIRAKANRCGAKEPDHPEG